MDRIVLRPFKSSIHLELRDSKGNVLKVIDDHNAETLWAKAHTPTTIYLDLVTQHLDTVLGRPLVQVNKTCYNKADSFRSRLLGTQFSRSGTTYDVTFNWTNNGQDVVTVYGLISFNGSNVYTLFDMSSDPIDVVPGNVLIGRYQITYDHNTPSVGSESYDSSTITSNTMIGGLLEETSPSIRDYKYTRSFVKTSEYAGVNTSDTNISSSISVDITSSDTYKRAYGNTNTGELFYKFLASGNPGGARAARYIRYYKTSHRSRLIAGNHTYEIKDYLYPIVRSDNRADTIFSYVRAKTLHVDQSVDEVRPWKINFPTVITDFSSSTWVWNGRGINVNLYQMLVPRYVRTASQDAFVQFVAYLYWNDNPTFNVYIYSYTGTITAKLYVNGVGYDPVSITDIGNRNRKIEFDLSGVSAGEGIVVFNAENAHWFTITNNGTDDIRIVTNKMAIESDMWGYTVPYVGFLETGSSNINSNWISSGMANFGAVDVDLVEKITDANISQLNLIQNTPIDQLRFNSEHQYFVWVKQSEFNKLAGKVGKGTEGKILTFWGRENWNHTNSHIAPVYVTDSNIIAFRATEVDETDNRSDWLGCEGILEDLYSLDHNNHIRIDHTNREITYLDDKPCYILRNDQDQRKSYVVRKQGQSDYNYRIPWAISDYTEGNATVLHDGVTFEFETTINTTETFRWLTVTFTSDSIFALNEYLSIPLSDANGCLFVDALETWKTYEVRNVPDNDATPIRYENAGTDDWITDSTENNITCIYNNLGEVQNVNYLRPNTDIKIGSDSSHYIPFSITYNPDQDDVKTVISLPRSFDDGGNLKFIDINSVIITDGLRVIPWSLDCFGSFRKRTDIDIEERFHSWILILSNDVLKQISSEKNTEILLYAYFKAKQKSELLPYEIEVKSALLGPQGANDSDSLLLFRVENGILKEVAKRDTHTNPGEYDFAYENISSSGDWFIFDKTQQSRIRYEGRDNSPIWVCSDNAHFTVDFWIRLNSLPDTGEVYYVLDNTYDGNNGFSIYIDENGVLIVRAQDTNILYSQKLLVGTEYYVAVVGSDYETCLYIDGIKVCTYPGRKSVNFSSNFPYFTIGCKRDESSGFLDAELKEFHISHVARWLNEHLPPTDTWDNVQNWPTFACNDEDYIIKVTLPFNVDRYINVVDQNGNDVEFTLLRDLNFPVEDDTYVGNHLYIKLPAIPYSSVSYQTVFRQGWSNWNVASNTPIITPAYNYNTVDFAYMLNSIHSADKTPSDIVLMSEESWDSTLIKPYKDNIPTTNYYTFTFTLQESATPKAQDPRTFFPLYLTPDRFASEGNKLSWTASDTYSNYFYYKPFLDGEGIQYNIEHCNILEIYSYYNLDESRGTVCKVSVYEGTGESSSFGPEITINNGYYKFYTLNDNVPFTGGSYTSDDSIKVTSLAKGRTLMLTDSINLHTIVGYRELPAGWWTNKSLPIAYTGSFDTPTDYNYYRLEGIDYPIYSLTTENSRIILTDGDRASLEFAAWTLEDDKALTSSGIAIRTYYVDSFEYHSPYYQNYVGIHPLSDPSYNLDYDIITTKLSDYNDDWKPKFMLINDSELIGLLTSDRIHFPYTEIAYVSDTYAGKVAKGTSISGTPTNSLVMYKYAISSFIQYPVASAYNGLTQAQFSVNVSADELYYKHRPKIHELMLSAWIAKDKATTKYKGQNIDTVNPYMVHMPQWLWLDINAKMNYLKQQKYIYYLNAKNYVDHDKLGLTHTTITNGTLDDDAIRCDVRIFPTVNSKYNILFDLTGIPVQDIVDLGDYVVIGSTDQNSDVNIYPIIKVVNTNDNSYTVFALDPQYGRPVDVTQYTDNFDDPINRKWFDTYYSKNVNSFSPFNSLLNTYNSPEYAIQYGWIIYAKEINFDLHYTIKGISIRPTFSDKSLYKPVDFAYVNVKSEVITDNKSDILPDNANFKVKVYNPNSINYTDLVVRIDLSEINLSTFSNGIVLYDQGGSPIPTIYETGDYQQVTNDYSKFNGRYVWIRIPSIDANVTLEFTLYNVVNTYDPEDIFDFYSDFETIDTGKWDISWTESPFSGSGGDTDNGTGATSTSDRVVRAEHNLPAQSEDKSLVFSNKDPILLSTKSDIDTSLLWEVGYEGEQESYVKMVYCSTTPDVNTETLVPYWHENQSNFTSGSASGGDIDNGTGATSETYRGCFAKIPDREPLTWIRTYLTKGKNEFYVYYDSSTADDISNGFNVFDFFTDFDNSDNLVGNWTDISNSYIYTNRSDRWFMFTASVGKYNRKLDRTLQRFANSSHYAQGWRRIGVDAHHSYISVYQADTPSYYIGDVSIGSSNQSTILASLQSDLKYILSVQGERKAKRLKQTNANDISTSNEYFRCSSWYSAYESAPAYCYYWCTGWGGNGIVINYESEESGSWTVDGHTFAKRKKIVINSTQEAMEVVNIPLKLSEEVVGFPNIRITTKVTEAEDLFSSSDHLTFDLVHSGWTPNSKIHSSINQTIVEEEVEGIDRSDDEWWGWYTQFKTDLQEGVNEFYIYYGSSAAPEISDTLSWTVKRSSNNLYDARFVYLRNWKDNASTSYFVNNNYYARAYELITHFLVNVPIAKLQIIRSQYNSSGNWVYINYGGCFVSYLSNNGYYGDQYDGYGRLRIHQTYDLHTVRQYTTDFLETIQYKYRFKYNHIFYTSGTVCYYDYILPVCQIFVGFEYLTSRDSSINTGQHHQRINSLEITPRMKGANYNLTTSNEETGSWTIGGYGFTKRRKLTINSNENLEHAIITISDYLYNNESRIKITKVKRGGGSNLPKFDHTNTSVNFAFLLQNNNSYFKVKPNRSDSWFIEQFEESNIDLLVPSSGRLHFLVDVGERERTFKLHYVRAYKKPTKPLVQLMQKDTKIIFLNKPTIWYEVDYTENQTPNTTVIQTRIQEVRNKNLSFKDIKKWLEFPDICYIARGIYVNERYLNYSIQ